MDRVIDLSVIPDTNRQHTESNSSTRRQYRSSGYTYTYYSASSGNSGRRVTGIWDAVSLYGCLTAGGLGVVILSHVRVGPETRSSELSRYSISDDHPRY